MTEPTPNPGSEGAVSQGCTCPVIDNHYGKGAHGDGKEFWYSEECPIHMPAMKRLFSSAERMERDLNISGFDEAGAPY